jgi:hypothetical protein
MELFPEICLMKGFCISGEEPPASNATVLVNELVSCLATCINSWQSQFIGMFSYRDMMEP